MTAWMIWIALAGALVILELLTGTFYILMIAIGLAFGAVVAVLGYGMAAQIISAAIVAVAATALLHRTRLGRPARGDSSRDPNMNIDIGQSVKVDAWHEGKARVMYRGALWDIELGPGAIAEAGSFKIVEVQGNRLVVANK